MASNLSRRVRPTRGRQLITPWIPTPVEVIRRALELAWAGPCDVVYDLGSGDGRVVIIAARDFKVKKAVGVELDPMLVEVARYKAREEGVDDKVVVIEGDFFEVPIEEATIVYLYLYKSVNEQLRPKLERELELGTRVVTIDFPMPDWTPVDVKRVMDSAGIVRTVHLYVMGFSDSVLARRGAAVERGPALEALLGCGDHVCTSVKLDALQKLASKS